jgi:signal transduction histidine kinase
MPIKRVLRSAIVILLLLAVHRSAADDNFTADSNLTSSREVSRPRGTPSPKPSPRTPRTESNGLNQIDDLIALLSDNKPIVIYGAIASFGILMMGLAIGSASTRPANEANSQLELLKQEKEKAENLAKLKSEFLNQVSHELRTPLAVIIGYIECITDGLYGEIETKHQEILQVVAKQSSHLKNMIDQILIYSRLEAGKQPVRIEDLTLTKMVSEMKETFDFLCKQKGLRMSWDIPDSPLQLRSDPVRVKEIVSNLIQNAVKYTDRGSVALRIEAISGNQSILIEVSDTGMGISEHHLSSIFEPFMQAHKTSTENSRGGIGLGLSIVKKHLEQIGGTIQVKSELGKGTTFCVVVPRSLEEPKSRTRRLFGLIRKSASNSAPAPL